VPTQLTKVLKLLFTLLVPILVIGAAASLLATDSYLAFEYGRTGFPPDRFGFTTRQRFVFASTNVHYVRAHLPSDELAKQTQDGVPLYNPREVTHMADVRAVFQLVMQVWRGSIILAILMGWLLWRNGGQREFASAVQSGGILTVAVIGSIALLALFAWQTWFDNFHLIFFKPGSWLFSYSDTLIRLFPVEFWFDATLTISILSFTGGLGVAFAGWRWQKYTDSLKDMDHVSCAP
jgi:integral membrane protein (TIGR01906 family)